MSFVERLNGEVRDESDGIDEPNLFPRRESREPRIAVDGQCMRSGVLQERSGQSLLETALFLPLLLTIVVNAVSIGTSSASL